MSISTLIIGESGTGKTCSLRRLNPAECLLIQPIRKPLPFKPEGWAEPANGQKGNICVSADYRYITRVMAKTDKKIIVIDDFQYILAALYVEGTAPDGKKPNVWDKYDEICNAGWYISKQASQLAPDVRVYVLGHTQNGEDGITRIKTFGKQLDSKIVLEGLFTNVLRTRVINGNYEFLTHNSGADTVKTAYGMFEDESIENDLAKLDSILCAYYNIKTARLKQIPARPASAANGAMSLTENAV